MTEVTQENPVIDDISLRHRVRVGPEIYNAFVPNSNYKSDITISPELVNFQQYTLTSKLTSQEMFQLQLTPGVLNSSGIEAGYEQMDFTINNIRWSQDINICSYQPALWKCGTDMNGTVANFDNGSCIDNMLGLPCLVPGVYGFTCDPINALNNSINNKYGGNGIEVTTQLDTNLLDFYYRSKSEEYLRSVNPLLIPDKVKDNTLFKYWTMPKLMANAEGLYDTSNSSISQVIQPSHTNALEMLQDWKNAFGVKGRYVKPDGITFQKSQKSANYIWNDTDKVFIVDPANNSTTNLTTIEVCGMKFPSNLTNGMTDVIKSGISVFQAFFYFDKSNDIMLNNTGFGGLALKVGKLAVGVLWVPLPSEPSSQSIIQTLSFKNIKAMLNCDELTQFNHHVFYNLSKLSITKNLRSDPQNILTFNLPFQTPLTVTPFYEFNTATKTYAHQLSLATYPTCGNINVSLVTTAPYLRLKQYTLPLSMKIADTCTIAYLSRNPQKHPFSYRLGNKKLKDVGNLVLTSAPLPFGKVPYATAFFLATRDTITCDMVTKSPMSRAIIDKMKIKISGNDWIQNSWTSEDYYKATKKNGLENYNLDFIRGMNAVFQNVDETVGQVDIYTSIIPTQDAIVKYQGALKKTVAGSIILVRWGIDVSLPSSLVSGVSNLQQTIQYEWEVHGDDDTTNIDMYQIDFNEEQMVITNDGNCAKREIFFSREDAVKAYQSWNSKVATSSLYINESHLRGSGFFGNLVNKVSSMLPKILPTVVKGLDLYDKHKDIINAGVGMARDALSNQGGSISGRQALDNLVKR